MNKDIFDVLDNADDEMIERLSSFTDDNDEAKKRITEMSERKYQNLKAGISANEGKDKNEITMNVTEKRPVRWYKPLAAVAAVAVIIAGVSLITNSLDKSKDPLDDLLPPAESTEAVTDYPSPKPVDTEVLPSEDHMKEMYDRFADFYSDIYETLISKQYEPVEAPGTERIFGGRIRMLNNDNVINVDRGTFTEATHIYKFNDERFSTLDEFNEYYSHFFDGTDVKFSAGKKYDKPEAGESLVIDITSEEYYKNDMRYMIMDLDGELYINEYAVSNFYFGPLGFGSLDINDYYSEHSFIINTNSFRRIRLFKDDQFIYALSVVFTKGDDNLWSFEEVDPIGFDISEYRNSEDYTSDFSDIIWYKILFDRYPDVMSAFTDQDENLQTNRDELNPPDKEAPAEARELLTSFMDAVQKGDYNTVKKLSDYQYCAEAQNKMKPKEMLHNLFDATGSLDSYQITVGFTDAFTLENYNPFDDYIPADTICCFTVKTVWNGENKGLNDLYVLYTEGKWKVSLYLSGYTLYPFIDHGDSAMTAHDAYDTMNQALRDLAAANYNVTDINETVTVHGSDLLKLQPAEVNKNESSNSSEALALLPYQFASYYNDLDLIKSAVFKIEHGTCVAAAWKYGYNDYYVYEVYPHGERTQYASSESAIEFSKEYSTIK